VGSSDVGGFALYYYKVCDMKKINIPAPTNENPYKINLIDVWRLYRRFKKWLKHRKNVLEKETPTGRGRR
jgi:hypothetical protein